MIDVFKRFRESVMGEPQVFEIPLTKCVVCNREFSGVVCPGCGWNSKPKKDEPTILQRFVKSLRTPHNVVVKSVDWSADLQVCFYCGSQFSRELDKCIVCNRKVPDAKERFKRSLR